jgi:hypothetical protein
MNGPAVFQPPGFFMGRVFLFDHDLRASAFRVCREGEPVPLFLIMLYERGRDSTCRDVIMGLAEIRIQLLPEQ